jgi:hypothetical protein
MGTTGTLLYSLTDLGLVSLATLQADLLAPPVPPAVLKAFGLRVTSDAPFAPPPGTANRKIVVSFVPSVTGAAHTNRGGNGEVASIVVDVNGLDYILPPIIGIPAPPPGGTPAMGEAFLSMFGTTITNGGVAYFAGTTRVALVGGLPARGYRGLKQLCVSGIRVLRKGKGYLPTDTIQIIENATPQPTVVATAVPVVDANGSITSIILTDMGANYITAPTAVVVTATGTGAALTCDMAEGTPAQATATVVLGVVTAIVIGTSGDGYIGVPEIVVTDPSGGSGFVGVARMGVGRIATTRHGKGYPVAPPVTVTPFYQYTFPTNATQATPLFGLMQGALEASTLSPVQETPPVVT